MSETTEKLKVWIYRNAPMADWAAAGFDREWVKCEDLSITQLYGLAAGIVLSSTDKEMVGKRTDELCDLGLDRRKLMGALEQMAQHLE
jgi:hypothetical protein